MIPDRLLRILRSCESNSESRFPPTEFFNEGWMLRLILDAMQTLRIRDHELAFLDHAQWYSEARLSSRFHARSRADKLAEGFTHADGVIGHFYFNPSTAAGLKLRDDARQFVVVEAKMFSNLSTGTTNARLYDQAVRNVACMAEAISQSGRRLDDFERLGFFVIAPLKDKRRQLNSNLEEFIGHESMRAKLDQRIAAYEGESRHEEVVNLRKWETDSFLPLVERLVSSDALAVLSWEDCIAHIKEADRETGVELERFYSRCLDYGPAADA